MDTVNSNKNEVLKGINETNESKEIKGIKNIAIYVRKSRVSLLSDEDKTLEKHRRQLIRYAEDNELDYIVFEEITSGTSDNRTEFLRMINLIENFAFDGILCIHIDRLTRNELDKARLNKALIESDTKIIQLDPYEIIDLSNDSDYDNVAFRSFFAEYEARQIKRRFKAGKIRSALQGKWIQEPPYGYRIGVDGHLEIVESEAEILHELANRYINKEVPRVIAYDLNNRGVPSPKGSIWRDKSIRVMLANEVYIGIAIYGKAKYPKKGVKIEKAPEEVIRVENAHPPIFDMDTWNKIRVAEEGRRHTGKTINGTHIFSGLLKCPVCGSALAIRNIKYSRKHDKRKTWIAKCSNRDALGNMCKNEGKGMYENVLRIALHTHLENYYSHLLILNDSDNVDKDKAIKFKKDKVQIEKEIMKLMKAKERLLELYEYGDIDRDTYNTRVAGHDSRIEDLNKKKDEIEDNDLKKLSDEERMKQIKRIKDILLEESPTNEDKRTMNKLLKVLIEKIEVIHTNEEVEVNITYN